MNEEDHHQLLPGDLWMHPTRGIVLFTRFDEHGFAEYTFWMHWMQDMGPCTIVHEFSCSSTYETYDNFVKSGWKRVERA